MPSTGYLQRTLKLAEVKAKEAKTRRRAGPQRLAAMATGLVLAGTVFFVLKGLAIAAGIGLPGQEGLAFWLSGPDPVSTAFGAAFQPAFAGRG